MQITESKFRAIMTSVRSYDGQPSEKRKTPRVGVGMRGRALIHATRRVISVFIRDMSAGGIGISCEQQMAEGDHFSLVLSKADGKLTHVHFEVRNCRPAMEGIFDVGARIVEMPPAESTAATGTPVSVTAAAASADIAAATPKA